MSQKNSKLKWNLLFILILFSIGYGVYAASQKVDYIWRWERIPQYIIFTGMKETVAPFDGDFEIKNNIPTLVAADGEEFVIEKYDTIIPSDGDMIFEGDILSKQKVTQMGPLLLGLFVTLQISIISIVFAIIIGIAVGIARISSNPVLKNLSITYVELIRGTPLLVQIFIFYYFVGTIFELSKITSGVVALAVFTGAYLAEIVRAGIQSIHKGQMEAARSLGMSYFQAMRYIILPQALKRTLPPMAGQFISLIKDSSLVSVIAITDLTKAGREVVSNTFSPFEVWFTVALMYLVLTSTLSYLVQRLEWRLSESD